MNGLKSEDQEYLKKTRTGVKVELFVGWAGVLLGPLLGIFAFSKLGYVKAVFLERFREGGARLEVIKTTTQLEESLVQMLVSDNELLESLLNSILTVLPVFMTGVLLTTGVTMLAGAYQKRRLLKIAEKSEKRVQLQQG